MPKTVEDKDNIRAIYGELCQSYRAIDDFRSKLLSLLPLATGGLFFFVTDPDGLIGKAVNAGDKTESVSLSPVILQAIGWFGLMITLGLYCYELYGIRKCTSLICLGEHLEDKLETKGQFNMRPDGILHDYFGDKYNFLAINEPFAAGIIYPAVMAAWTFLAFSRTGFAMFSAIFVFVGVFLLSVRFMYCLRNEITDIKSKFLEEDSKPDKTR